MNGAEFLLIPLGDLDSDELGSLALITLCDPGRNGNALDMELLRCLVGQLQTWQSQNIRALILRSSSEIAFSVGMNFDAFQSQASHSVDGKSGGAEQSAASWYRTCLDSFYQFPAPVLCLLEKPARAGGVGLLMAADLILATQAASMTLGEALFGLIPANVLPYLRKRISERRANQMVFIPEAVKAETLYQWGLIDFPPIPAGTAESIEGVKQKNTQTHLEKALKKVLRSVLRCSPSALAKQKLLCRQLNNLSFEEQQELVEDTLAKCLEDPDVSRGIAAFLAGDLGIWSTKTPKSLIIGI